MKLNAYGMPVEKLNKNQSTNMWDLDSRKTASAKLNGELNDVFLMPLTLTLQNPVSHAESMVVWNLKILGPSGLHMPQFKEKHAIFVLRWGFDWRKKAPIATRCAPTSYKCSYNTYRQLLNGFPWCFFSSPKEVVEWNFTLRWAKLVAQPNMARTHGLPWDQVDLVMVYIDQGQWGISGHRWWQELVVDIHSCQRIPS